MNQKCLEISLLMKAYQSLYEVCVRNTIPKYLQDEKNNSESSICHSLRHRFDRVQMENKQFPTALSAKSFRSTLCITYDKLISISR